MIGRILGGRYELLELIGTGGMSKVYKAKCRLLNRFVAVKILKEEYNADKEFVKRFYIESQAAASLSSTNIVSVYDVGEEENTYYIVMEYVEGVTLKEVIKENGVLAWNVALNFALQILSALECAHKNGIVHRDIKPQNIIVTDEGILKVTDFGIARAVNGDETKKIDRDVLGSVHYISPEQAKGIMIDARSDLYSLGIVMYEMLTGKLPYDGNSAVSVALMHLNSEPQSIKDLNISVPNELVRMVTKSMQRDVLNRYQTAKEMAEEFNEFKKAEKLTTKEQEDAFIKETIAMVQLAKKANEPAVLEDKVESEKEDTYIKKLDKEDKHTKKTAFWKDKKERTAVISAIGLSAVIVALMVFLFAKVFFPNLDFSSLFESKEFLLPNVVDKYIEDVQPMLEAEGLKVTVNEVEDNSREDGLIINQYPSGNIMVKVRKTTVQLSVVKNDDGTEKIKVPKVVNKEYRQAKQELEKAGFMVRIVEEVSEDIPVGFVIRQTPSANQEAKKGAEIAIYVAKEDENAEIFVPNFVGMTEAQAKEKADDIGLVITFVEKAGTENVGKVTEQSISKETLVNKGTSIRLTIIGKGDTPASPSISPTPTTPVVSEASQTLTIDLPQDREQVTVVVKKAGSEVYRRAHNTSERRITVTVKGSGTQKVEILQDGQVFFSQNIKFN
ncbi:MAG: Stk1 family PASTA domain-containing Ser/Thr kinase [Clostridia bacterium]|nr:Stk1 family PASTA domain-containing Ser/Thr kinase [Clostridia bacterium]